MPRKVTVSRHHSRSGRETYMFDIACSCGHKDRACGHDNASERALKHQDRHIADRYGHTVDDQGRRRRDRERGGLGD